MKKKVLSILLAAAMVASMAAGCGSGGEEASGSGEGSGSTESQGGENSITVLVKAAHRPRHWQMRPPLILRRRQGVRLLWMRLPIQGCMTSFH